MAYGSAPHLRHRLLLEPRQATFFGLIRLLFSSNIQNRSFIDTSEKDIRTSLYGRWIIFISLLLQKFLLLVRIPMALMGDIQELGLNLLSGNGGFFGLLLNILKRQIVWPDKTSATYVSVVGNWDLRVDLDSQIKAGDTKYNVFLSLMAAKVAYENEAFIKSVVTNNWNMEFLGFDNYWDDHQGQPSTQAFLLQDTTSSPNLVVVAFRGTSPYDAYDWCTDVDLSWYQIEGVGKLHRGFLYALGQQKTGWPVDINQDDNHLYAYYAIKAKLKEIVADNPNVNILVAGHSLGGALAILFAGMLIMHDETVLLGRLKGVYTFGQPRVGDADFGEFMVTQLQLYDVDYVRTVYCNDIVPRVPFDDKCFLFKHFGVCYYYNSLYREKICDEEPNKNYFSLLLMIPMYMNAFWELIRSFLLPLVRGKEYKEGWFMTSTRVMPGFVLPGLPAHLPQDYDNSIRLG